MSTHVWFWTVLLSLLPISELRGAIPYAMTQGIPFYLAWPLCILLNALVSPLVYIFLVTLHKLFSKWDFYNRLFEKIIENARHKLHDKIVKYGYMGVTLFVAIPLPVTGAYTGTLGAWILGLSKRKTMISVFAGVIISGTIVTGIMLFGHGAFSLFIKNVH